MNYTVEQIEGILTKRGKYLEYCDDYGEKGYSKDDDKDENVILFSDWNDLPKHVMNAIERQYTIEWDDEWIIDYENYPCKAYRTTGDCWSWKPYYHMNESGECYFGDVVENDFDEQSSYIEDILLDNPNVCCLFDFDLSAHGFANMNGEFEHGWYGRCDNPHEILKAFQEKFPAHEFIFANLSNEQFRSNFEIWGRERK